MRAAHVQAGFIVDKPLHNTYAIFNHLLEQNFLKYQFDTTHVTWSLCHSILWWQINKFVRSVRSVYKIVCSTLHKYCYTVLSKTLRKIRYAWQHSLYAIVHIIRVKFYCRSLLTVHDTTPWGAYFRTVHKLAICPPTELKVSVKPSRSRHGLDLKLGNENYHGQTYSVVYPISDILQIQSCVHAIASN